MLRRARYCRVTPVIVVGTAGGPSPVPEVSPASVMAEASWSSPLVTLPITV